MVFLMESGFAQRTDVARAFNRSVRTIRRYQERYADGGMAALSREEGWRHGRRRISGQRLRSIEMMKSQGMSNRAIAHRLGVSEKAIRKLVGPSNPAESAQLALPAIPTSAENLTAIGAPAETPTMADANGANASVKEGAKDRDPVTAPEAANDDEPVPMSLDRDAEDRTFDRQLAYLGLLDDAAPLFREGSSVAGVGVLLALPCLVESGLLQISRKLYGDIGPAFYGLRTTLLTLLLMALLRIKRPEHLKEKDPAAFGRLLGLDRAPEVKTLRRGLTRLAAHHCAEQLGAELARVRVDRRGHLMGFLYVDGHVRAYHGERTISSNAYVARRHLAMPATTDYWVNDRAGDPLLVITGEVDAALTKAMPRLLREVRDVVGERKVTIVFDRGGWSPQLFATMIRDGFDVLTYRKGGYVWLGEKNEPGLDAYLFEALRTATPIVGVAKTPYRNDTWSERVYRGESRRPLYVTAVRLRVAKLQKQLRSFLACMGRTAFRLCCGKSTDLPARLPPEATCEYSCICCSAHPRLIPSDLCPEYTKFLA